MCDNQARQSTELAVPWRLSVRESCSAKPLASTSPPKALPMIEIKIVHLQEWRGQQGVPLLARTVLCKKIWSCLLPPAGRLISFLLWEYHWRETWLYYACRYVISKPSIEAVEWLEARGKLSVCSLQINDLVAWFGCEFVPSKSSVAENVGWCFACRNNVASWKKQQLFCLEVVGSIRVHLIGM